MKKVLICILLITPFSGFSQNAIEVDSTNFNEIIGLEREEAYVAIKGEPWGGKIIGYEEPSEVPIMTWSLGIIKVGVDKVFTLEEILNDDDPEKENKFIIRDQILISSSNPKHIVAIGCKVNGKDLYPEGSYMGLYLYENRGLNDEIITAWKIDFKQNRIIEIPTKGMTCNSDYFSVPFDKEI